ncbi:BgTH12-03776 [Blumeria graminis f. sp. triticale]|uniref:BgtAc-30683 n=3 Tax=Blumeria graminis TaxID=34373 RepID=A0A9X9PRC7_BLUGR|nr:hypothetical protein BGT96224_Ac30683 [Blumeria graminis f. sp. tritici 96224]CAD6499668.1 BgTH12-03776 [Blumeria graminis f. sp. triticale]VCU39835.1 BgtAc-30683 [Blumeria graminis f. sp. tritici]
MQSTMGGKDPLPPTMPAKDPHEQRESYPHYDSSHQSARDLIDKRRLRRAGTIVAASNATARLEEQAEDRVQCGGLRPKSSSLIVAVLPRDRHP